MGFRDSVWLDDPRVRTGLTVFAAGVSTVGTSFALYGTTREFVVIGASRLALDLLPDRLLADIIWSLGDYSLALALVCFGVLLAGVAVFVANVALVLRRHAPHSLVALLFGAAVRSGGTDGGDTGTGD